MRKRQHQRRIDPQIRPHTFGTAQEPDQLARDFCQIPLAGKFRGTGRDRIQPEYAILFRQLGYHVVVAGWMFAPVFGKADYVVLRPSRLPRTRVSYWILDMSLSASVFLLHA